MALSDFVQKQDALLAVQLTDFAIRLPTHATAVGVTAGEQAAAVNDAAMFQFYVLLLARSDDYKRLLVANKDKLKLGPIGATPPPSLDIFDPGSPPTGVLPGIVPRFRNLAKKIKAAPGYTSSIGVSLGIVGPAPTPDPNPKPVLKGLALPNWQVQIKFKKGTFSGIYIEMKRGTAAWAFLDRAVSTKYIDMTPPLVAGQPEERQYRARFMTGNVQVGQWSDELVELVNS